VNKVFIATLGFDEKFVIGGLVRNNVSKGDRVFLLTVEPIDEKVLTAYNRVREFTINYVKGVKPELVSFPLKNFADLTKRIIEFMDSILKRKMDLYVNLSGGMRVLVLSTYNALFFLSRKLADYGVSLNVEVELENRAGIFEAGPGFFNLAAFYSDLTRGDLDFLELIGERSSLRELTEKTGLQPSTISKKLDRMKRFGLVKVISRKPLVVRKTEYANLVYLIK